MQSAVVFCLLQQLLLIYVNDLRVSHNINSCFIPVSMYIMQRQMRKTSTPVQRHRLTVSNSARHPLHRWMWCIYWLAL